ncbi:DNA-binding protein (plasmid) [Methylobacterium currus]|uniref:DNA-binding protein n=1 Tax=Methylobacterium currus TaxID=2051553 RepID=A0A2R4WXE4_9HYPH|nr:helix-turn-helix domain-containing protein [Methylobacterium currus]AWB26208.1 DNA-binding protein [Methylobacterium currus]
MSDDLDKLLSQAMVGPALAFRVLNISPSAGYRALASGEIPNVKVGGQYRVPTAKLREMLGLSAAPSKAA